MDWLNKKVSLYFREWDKIGQPATLRNILLCESIKDIQIIVDIRKLDINDPDYKIKAKEFKSKLQLFSPAALMATREAGNVQIIDRSGIMQLDFDYADIKQYDIEKLKRAVFALPFVAFCGLSCSGKGFYALIAIGEPERLRDYAEHCFRVFAGSGIHVDKSKGRNPNDLRYSSYDSKMLIRDNPTVLQIPPIVSKPKERKRTYKLDGSGAKFIQSQLNKIKVAKTGNRWHSVQQVAYTLGGTPYEHSLELIKSEIQNNPEFRGQEEKYIKCAEDCFTAGINQPLEL